MKSTKTILPEYLENKLPAIQALCRKYQVEYLYAIGSVLTSEFGKNSDVDFLYDLDRAALATGQYLHNLDGLIAGLLKLFPGRKIDLVHYPSLRNPYFIKDIDATKTLLYAQRSEEVSV